jgi:hypothetical protein
MTTRVSAKAGVSAEARRYLEEIATSLELRRRANVRRCEKAPWGVLCAVTSDRS